MSFFGVGCGVKHCSQSGIALFDRISWRKSRETSSKGVDVDPVVLQCQTKIRRPDKENMKTKLTGGKGMAKWALWPWNQSCWRYSIPKSWGYSPPLRFKMIQFIFFGNCEVWSSTDGNFQRESHRPGLIPLSTLTQDWGSGSWIKFGSIVMQKFVAMGIVAEFIAIWFSCKSCQSDLKFWCHRKKMSRTKKNTSRYYVCLVG